MRAKYRPNLTCGNLSIDAVKQLSKIDGLITYYQRYNRAIKAITMYEVSWSLVEKDLRKKTKDKESLLSHNYRNYQLISGRNTLYS